MGKRGRGTGHLYEKYGYHYGRWRTLDGRLLNRLIGPVRTPEESDGLTRSQAERAFRKLHESEESSPRPARGARVQSLDEVTDSLWRRLAVHKSASPMSTWISAASVVEQTRRPYVDVPAQWILAASPCGWPDSKPVRT
jgi:hypothetical protein